MPTCYTCHEEITFDKNIRSKSGKQIPLWIDLQNTHGHDEDGNPIRGPLPSQQQFQQQQPAQQQQHSKHQGDDRYARTALITTEGGATLDTKRIFQVLKEIGERLTALEQRLEYHTQVDTDKLIGQLQTIEEIIAPLLKTQIKKASDIYTEQKKDSLSINHGEKADKYQQAFQDRRKVVEEGSIDRDEFEETQKFDSEDFKDDDDRNTTAED